MCKCGPVYSGGLYETTAVWTIFSIAEVQQKREDPSACNFIFQRVHLSSLRPMPVRKVMDMFHSWISRRFHCLIVLGSLRLSCRIHFGLENLFQWWLIQSLCWNVFGQHSAFNVVCLMLMVIEFIGMNGKGERKEERIRRKMLLSKSVFSVEHKRTFTKHRSITPYHSEVTLFKFKTLSISLTLTNIRHIMCFSVCMNEASVCVCVSVSVMWHIID